MINKKIIIMLIGAVVIAVCAEVASAEDIPIRENETSTNSITEEIIEPETIPDGESEPVLIAPRPDETLKDDEAIPDMSMYNDENVDDEGNPVLIMGAETSGSVNQNKANISNLPAIVLIGAVIILVLGLILMKKK
jgi:hypothetical protein